MSLISSLIDRGQTSQQVSAAIAAALAAAHKTVALAGDVTNSTVTPASTGLTFPIGANEVWVVEWNLSTGCSGVGGMKFQIDGPAGMTLRGSILGNSSNSTSFRHDTLTALDTANASAFNASAVANDGVRIAATVRAAGTAGTVTLEFFSVTDTQVSTIFANSYLVARKVA